MVVSTLVAVKTRSEELEREAKATDLLYEMEFFSYNMLLDLCWNINSSAVGSTHEEVAASIASSVEGWCDMINSGEIWIGHVRPRVSVGGISVEEFNGQGTDAFQMSCLGGEAGRRWFVTGNMAVEFIGDSELFRGEFAIRIAV